MPEDKGVNLNLALNLVPDGAHYQLVLDNATVAKYLHLLVEPLAFEETAAAKMP